MQDLSVLDQIAPAIGQARLSPVAMPMTRRYSVKALSTKHARTAIRSCWTSCS